MENLPGQSCPIFYRTTLTCLLISITTAIVSGIAFSKASSSGSSLSKLNQPHAQDALHPTTSTELRYREKMRFLEERLLVVERAAEQQRSLIEEQNRTSNMIEQYGQQTRLNLELERNETIRWRLIVNQELNLTKFQLRDQRKQLVQARVDLIRQSRETSVHRQALDHRLNMTTTKFVEQVNGAILRRQDVDKQLNIASNKLESQQKQATKTSALLRALTGSVSSLSSKFNVSFSYHMSFFIFLFFFIIFLLDPDPNRNRASCGVFLVVRLDTLGRPKVLASSCV